MNCRNIRREIEEARPGDLLSSGVNDHVLSCVACQTLLQEQTKLQELVSSLGIVEAPGDFDFRLRARLAGEKRALPQPFGFGNFSFGLRSAAAVTLLLVIGSALMLLNLRTRTNPVGNVANVGSNSEGTLPTKTKGVVGTLTSDVAGIPQKAAVVDNGKTNDQSVRKGRNGLRPVEIASRRDFNNQSTRDLSSTPAEVLKSEQLAGVFPAAAFPIDGGYQSLKVSVDDSRGISRTISLPTVSFGSQRSLTQGASPLVASARGAW